MKKFKEVDDSIESIPFIAEPSKEKELVQINNFNYSYSKFKWLHIFFIFGYKFF